MSIENGEHVERRLQHAVAILDAVHLSLSSGGHSDLASAVALVREDVFAALDVIRICIERTRNKVDKHIIKDLHLLVGMAGSKAIPVVMRVARRIVARDPTPSAVRPQQF